MLLPRPFNDLEAALTWAASSRLISRYRATLLVNELTRSSPDRVDFLAGQFFDIRLEVHSPVNGSEARVGEPDPNFTFTISKKGGNAVSASEYFKVNEPKLERWIFTWYEGKTLCLLSLILRNYLN